jgi:F-type H+-transporting ATPase subunit epsilon
MALPTHIRLELVTPDHAVAHEDVDEIVLPCVGGALGVLPGHAPMLAMLDVGQMWYRRGSHKTYVSVAFGVAEILPDRVILLCRDAERGDEIDVARAEAAAQRAQAALQEVVGNVDDFERARIALLKAMTRLNVAAKVRTRG